MSDCIKCETHKYTGTFIKACHQVADDLGVKASGVAPALLSAYHANGHSYEDQQKDKS